MNLEVDRCNDACPRVAASTPRVYTCPQMSIACPHMSQRCHRMSTDVHSMSTESTNEAHRRGLFCLPACAINCTSTKPHHPENTNERLKGHCRESYRVPCGWVFVCVLPCRLCGSMRLFYLGREGRPGGIVALWVLMIAIRPMSTDILTQSTDRGLQFTLLGTACPCG